ncbi:MAG: MMPL family transporter [Myxococcales bacterium]|nr:MMPL family transporter [Myxococcales bacterium]
MTEPDHDLHHNPPSPAFDALGRFVVRGRWWILLATLALLVGSVWVMLATTTIDTSVEKFAQKDSPSQKVLALYRDEFGRDEMFFLVVTGDVFTLPFLERLRALHAEAAALDMPLSSLGARGKQGGLLRDALFGPESPARRLLPGMFDEAAEEPAEMPEKPAEAPAEAPAANADDAFDFDDAGGEAGWGEEAGGTVVEQATSLVNVRRTRGGAAGIAVGQLLDPWPTEATLPALRAEVLGDRTLVGNVVGQQGRHAVIALRTQFMSEGDSAKVYERLLELAAAHEAPGFHVDVGGAPALNAGLQAMLLDDLVRLVGLSALAMFVIMAWMFRHPIAVVAPMLVVALSALATAAMMGLVGMPLTLMSNVLPAFLFCVGIGHSVHIISVLRDRLREGFARDEALRIAVGSTGRPVFYTSLTTMVGLGSFVLASLDAIGEMGVAGAFGVFVAFVLSLTFLPAALSFVGEGRRLGALPPGERDFIDRFIDTCMNLSGIPDEPGFGEEPPQARRRRRWTLAGLGALTVVGLVGASLMTVWHNPLTWLPPETPMRVAFETMDTHVGGSGNVQLLIDGGSERGIKDLELMKGLEALRAHVEAFVHPEFGPIVGNTIGVVDVVKETNRALHGGDQAFYALPESDRGVADLLFMFENAGPDELRQLATTDLQRAQMTVRVHWLEATRYQSLVDHISAGIAAHVPAGATVQATGSVYTLVSTIGNILRDLISSFGSAFVVITLIMMVLLRGLKLGVVAMVPNLLPVILIGGVMGFGGIPIDMNNLMIASIVIGVAVDDTIHLMHHWRINMERTGGDVELSIRRAMRHSGRAMVATSVILLIGFSVYMGATMYNIQRFGFLVGLTAWMALFIDLIFGPALLRTFWRRKAPGPVQDTTEDFDGDPKAA